MSSPLLTTKFHIPQARTASVPRPRLVSRLQQGLTQKLILISAPAGYGKTTLLCEWLTASGQTTAWVSMDKGDNDPSRFWSYVIAALQDAFFSGSSTLSVIQTSPALTPNETFITELINELDKLPQSLILVLDDYHLIETQAIHDGLSFLLEHAPRRFHLVIATRADPPLPLARLRARSDLLELRLADLSFTLQEASAFLNRTMGLQISTEDVVRITARTEGWIAGMQIAALSMQNTNDISGFITAFTGSHHYIFDYLLEEILGRQSPEIRRFLLYTSILDQLSAPLCDALLEGEAPRSSSVILEELDHSNLFIMPLDHEHRWYRYHSLFAELLRGYLQQNNAGQIPLLHARAGDWFEKQGLIPDAIRHSLAAGEWERVLRLIGANVFALLEQSELNTVAKQLDSPTSEKSRARPWLLIGRAWLAAYTGQLSSIESILKTAESEISSFESQADHKTLGGHIALIRAYAGWIGDRRDIAIQMAQEALECLPETELLMRCHAATLLGLSLNDLNARARAFEQALVYARQIDVSHITIFAHACWAFLLLEQGRLREAYAASHEAIRLAQSSAPRQTLPTLSHVYSTLSFVLFEWNDLEGAMRYAREAVSLARRWGQADALHLAYTHLGEVLFATRDVKEAFDILHQEWQVASRTSVWFEAITIAQEVRWHLAQNDLDSALRRLRLAHVDIEKPSGMPLTSAQVLLAQKQYAKVLERVEPILEDLENRASGYQLVRVLIWQAMAYHGLGQEAQALDSLRHALTLAAPEGYIRTFIVSGPALIPLLHQARATGMEPDYVNKLLASVGQGGKTKSTETVPASRLVEPLSAREMDVLKLLAQACPDKKIAENLVITRETVHKHLKNIYGKLGVHSRTEAVLRARELTLL
ncbi:MAG: LuxR family transcriptional regulator [Chloroflexi bacterium]|nr:LuxR family transcriptional regulator [Chloroflexota bacterium]